MGAFILAGIVAVGTLALSALLLFANGMAAAPSASNAIAVGPVFWGGTILAALIAASHWLPHIGW